MVLSLVFTPTIHYYLQPARRDERLEENLEPAH
jgi:hypothetical protein